MRSASCLRGIFHVHSVFSYDGLLTLGEIRSLCEERNYDFVVLCDHDEGGNETKFKKLIDQCKQYSKLNFLMIPGIEYTFGNIHLLCFGFDKYITKSCVSKLIDDIHEQGGLVVLAHPKNLVRSQINEIIHNLDGIELWNMKFNYDGQFSPRLRNFRILNNARQRNKQLYGYGGLDLHWKYNFSYVSLSVFTSELDTYNIINSLRNGKFCINFDKLTLNSSGRPLKIKYVFKFAVLGFLYDLLFGLMKLGYQALKLLGIDSIVKPSRILNKFC